jgi:hypothetical protein
VEPDSQETAKQMRLRYAGSCSVCGGDLPAGVKAVYDRTSKTVRCLICVTDAGAAGEPVVVNLGDPAVEPSPDPMPSPEQTTGTAGSSARREYERRKARREDRIRTNHPRLSGVLLALFDEPQSTRAWQQGAIGEERLGARLDQLGAVGVATLHDRRIPGSRANIDHIVVAASGVWVVDAKRYKGRPALRVEGGILRPRVERLLVGRRDCTKLVDGVLKQVELVREALARADITVPVTGALAFVDADWPLIGGSFSTRGVHVLWPKRLQKLLLRPGQLEDVAGIRKALARHFPAA